MKKIKLNTYINSEDIRFGDFMLFQEYKDEYDSVRKIREYKISKPKLIVFLGWFVADQTIGFNYVQWVNSNHMVYVTNENVKNHPTCKEVKYEVEAHIEWNDYIDILGHWKIKPNWKQIISAYRKQTKQISINGDEIDFS